MPSAPDRHDRRGWCASPPPPAGLALRGQRHAVAELNATVARAASSQAIVGCLKLLALSAGGRRSQRSRSGALYQERRFWWGIFRRSAGFCRPATGAQGRSGRAGQPGIASEATDVAQRIISACVPEGPRGQPAAERTL